ncbi:MAG: HepT-like ribonuclease domain-containing protein [Anaerolineae bacterium]
MRDYLQDIAEYAEKAMRFLEDIPSPEALEKDERTLLAVIRALEVIGEAARQVAPEFRQQHPQLPWRGMIGMRDKIIHAYFGVDVAVVWRTVREDLPPLRQAVYQLLSEISEEKNV